MKRTIKRRFNALLHTFCSKRTISEEKAASMSEEDKKFMCRVIAGDRAAILSALVPVDPEFISWLSSMGYDYTYTNKQGLQFKGTCEHYTKYAVHTPV